MKAQLHSIFLSTMVLSASYANPLPTLSINSTDLDGTLTAIKTGVNCWPSSFRASRLAATRDCLQAALLLPDGPDPGDFHNGRPDNGFSLPLSRTFESCTAIVSLINQPVDRSSWDHISYVASTMAAVCSKGQYPIGQTGGVTTVGVRNSIRVSIERVGSVGDASSQR